MSVKSYNIKFSQKGKVSYEINNCFKGILSEENICLISLIEFCNYLKENKCKSELISVDKTISVDFKYDKGLRNFRFINTKDDLIFGGFILGKRLSVFDNNLDRYLDVNSSEKYNVKYLENLFNKIEQQILPRKSNNYGPEISTPRYS